MVQRKFSAWGNKWEKVTSKKNTQKYLTNLFFSICGCNDVHAPFGFMIAWCTNLEVFLLNFSKVFFFWAHKFFFHEESLNDLCTKAGSFITTIPKTLSNFVWIIFERPLHEGRIPQDDKWEIFWFWLSCLWTTFARRQDPSTTPKLSAFRVIIFERPLHDGRIPQNDDSKNAFLFCTVLSLSDLCTKAGSPRLTTQKYFD